jgi:chlorite dismutase
MEAPQVHGFLFLRIPSGRRTRREAERLREAVDAAGRETGVAGIYAYSLIGLRADVDLGFWIAADGTDAYQTSARALLQTDLEAVWTLWGYVKPSQYTGRDGTSVKVPGPRRRYLVVYPFGKTHEWYQLSPEIRRGMMTEHTRIGHSYEGIDQLLLYCTGIADWEFVVGYETDDLMRFQELVTAMRSTMVRPYTLRDTPTFTARFGELEDTLERIFG